MSFSATPASRHCVKPVYRILITGIPLNVTLEVFYDYLRAFTGHRAESALCNALLLRVPLAASNVEEGGASTKSAHLCTAPHLQPQRKKRRRDESPREVKRGEEGEGLQSTGAAFVDFGSKAIAERLLQGELYVAGVKVQWQPVGNVVLPSGSWAAAQRLSALTSEEAGRRAYTATLRRPPHKILLEEMSSAPPGNESNGITLKEAKCYSQDSGKVRDADEEKGNPREVTLRLVANQPLSRIYDINNKGEVLLFCDLERALRRRIMGILYSLKRISDVEVHISINSEAASCLLEEGKQAGDAGLLLQHVVSSSFPAAVGKGEESPFNGECAGVEVASVVGRGLRWGVRSARPVLDIGAMLSQGNMRLASKSEVLTAMAHTMNRTGGKYAAVRDAYGNFFFPVQ